MENLHALSFIILFNHQIGALCPCTSLLLLCIHPDNGNDLQWFWYPPLLLQPMLWGFPKFMAKLTPVNDWGQSGLGRLRLLWGVSHILPYGSLRRKLHAGFTCMIVPRGRYYMTHCIVKKNGGINKWSSFSKITQLWMDRDEVWMQVVLIPKAMLFRACISYYSLNEDDFSGHYASFVFFLNKQDRCPFILY